MAAAAAVAAARPRGLPARAAANARCLVASGGDGDGRVEGGSVAAGRGTAQDLVSSAAPPLPATTTAERRPDGVWVIDSSSPSSKKPGPDGDGVSEASPADTMPYPRPSMRRSAQSYPSRSPARSWTAHSRRALADVSGPSAGSSRSAPAGGLTADAGHPPPGVPTARSMTRRPDRQNAAATTSLTPRSAGTSPARKS